MKRIKYKKNKEVEKIVKSRALQTKGKKKINPENR